MKEIPDATAVAIIEEVCRRYMTPALIEEVTQRATQQVVIGVESYVKNMVLPIIRAEVIQVLAAEFSVEATVEISRKGAE